MKDAAAHGLLSIQGGLPESQRHEISQKSKERRTAITRASLELAMAQVVRESDPQCKALIGGVLKRVVPKSHGDANWTVKGVKYGTVERDRCGAAVSNYVEEVRLEFEISDGSRWVRGCSPRQIL
jgi:hypothetical protein